MKILHLIQTPQNRGAETFACQLANHQVSEGHEVKMVSVFSGEADLPWKERIFNLNASLKYRLLDFSAWKKLKDYIVEFQPDIVQANSGDTLKYAVLSKLIFRWDVPVVFRNASEVGRYLNSSFQKQFNKLLYKNVNGIISVSEASKNDLLRHFPFLKDRTQVIPVGLEENTNIETVQLQPEGARHVVHVGGFSFEKNHSGILRIFQKALKSVPNVHLHLVGDGPLRTEMENLVKEKGLKDKVSFYGFVNNPLSFIISADVLILPSIIEGLPGVLLEGMFCSTPVVAYNVGGISEIVTKETGELIEKNDEECFASSVVEILREPNQQKTNAARKMVEEEFMNTKIAVSFLEAYNSFV